MILVGNAWDHFGSWIGPGEDSKMIKMIKVNIMHADIKLVLEI